MSRSYAGIPVETVERTHQALKAANNPSQIVLYPDTSHGFHADYRKEQAADGWKRLLEWFTRHGVG